ncbi:MAG: DUF3833 family protein [Paracoccaceae bacterium]|nr:DUF3833 family protein [Paracoccaceae bacterium]
MMTLTSFLLGAAAMLAAVWARTRFLSFRAQRPEELAETGPVFDIRRHLNGPIVCEGVIYGPTGRVSSRFVADFEARWDGNKGVMTEHFRYDDGSTQDREWRLSVGNDGAIRAEADDLVGAGTGTQSGCGMLLNYQIRLPESSGGHVLDTTDWMYLVESGTIVNRSQFRKFGVTVAEIIATLRPKEPAAA